MTNTQLVPGSLAAMAAKNNVSLAQTWLSVDAVILVDISGSMDSPDCGGERRIKVAQRELEKLQKSLPGKLAIIQFSSDVAFNPTGFLAGTESTTDLAKALNFARQADKIPDMRFIVISDGQPDDEREALAAARMYKNKIDVIYIGPEGGAGGKFLAKLAAQAGGQSITKSELPKLADNVMKLLGDGR
jgi:Mg-chelatase subunit ChlD